MIDAIVMPILKCICSLCFWALLGSIIGFGVNYICGVDGLYFRASTLYLRGLEDWSWVVATISLIGIVTIFVVVLNLKL